jgi:hypothetical protein
MSTFVCCTCASTWTTREGEGEVHGERCHECTKAVVGVAIEALEFVANPHPKGACAAGDPVVAQEVLGQKTLAARIALKLLLGHAPVEQPSI